MYVFFSLVALMWRQALQPVEREEKEKIKKKYKREREREYCLQNTPAARWDWKFDYLS